MSDLTADERADDMGNRIIRALAHAQNNAARTRQAASRTLGMSDLGGCREFIRSTIAGDEAQIPDALKWPALVGTMLGDQMEPIIVEALKDDFPDAESQVTLTLELHVDDTPIRVTGHSDVVVPGWGVIDLKSKNGLATVRREGPSFKERVQISGYLIAGHQAGIFDDDAVGMLYYYDRSGADPTFHSWATEIEQAHRILEAASYRIEDVVDALNHARHAPRDEPESWCFAVKCPFYAQCWAGYMPDGQIVDEQEIDRVQRFIRARAEAAEAESRRLEAREALKGVEGVTPDGTVVQWTIRSTERGTSETLNVREKK